MTEAMSRRDIEDVLSSIKRLVSQDGQTRARPQNLHEKLVLTSEQRIDLDDAADTQDEEATAESASDTQLRVAAAVRAMASGQRFPEPHRAPPSRRGARSLLQRISHASTRAPLTATEVALGQEPAGPVSQAAPEPEPQPEPQPAAPRPASTAAPEPQHPDPAPLTSAFRSGRLTFAPDPAPQPEPIPTQEASPATREDPDDAEDIEDTLARLEAVLSGKPLPAAKAPPATEAPPQAEPEPTPDTDLTPHEIVLDEEALFRMVSDIVRLELQGELGEKITRNIRKLVRAEVARELQLRRT